MSKKRKREESTPKPSIKLPNYDFVIIDNKYLVPCSQYLEICNSQQFQQKKQKASFDSTNLSQNNLLSLSLNSTDTNFAIDEVEHQLLGGPNHRESNFPISSNSNIEQEQILFSGTNIPVASAQLSTNVSSVPNQAQPITVIYVNDAKCKYHSVKNVIDVRLNCFHPKCHHRKLSQKIDKIAENKDQSADMMMKTKNNIYSILSKYKDPEFIKAILAVKNDQGTYLLDKAIAKGFVEIATILYNFGAETDIPCVQKIIKSENYK